MNNIVNINLVNPETLEFQEYSNSDENLISHYEINDISFDNTKNYIEFHILDLNKQTVHNDYNLKSYRLEDNKIVLDPEQNLKQQGFEEGQYYTLYNILTPLFNSNSSSRFYISEISSDRTEVRLSTNDITSSSLSSSFVDFVSGSNTTNYYRDFHLNFGDNNLIIANNVLLDDSLPESPDLLVKLYEPLPFQFTTNSQLWIVEELSNPVAYSVELITVFDNTENNIKLKGPNLNISVKDRINNSTDYQTYSSLHSTVSTSSILGNQLSSFLQDNSIELNTDYSDYNNFIHFSSAQTRLENFYYKLGLIESYTSQSISASIISQNQYISGSGNVWDNKIKDLITNFDGYEYYLYYSSGSTAWPKTNNTQPYINYSTSSITAQNWLTGQLSTASLYDSQNPDYLVNTIPSYLREDDQNANYQLFVEMLGQHFDNIYLYYNEITNKYNADNRIDHGLSKDLVADALRDFGIKIYQNNFSSNDLYTSFLGITQGGSLLPPTGSELITNYVTASNQVIPLDDVNKEIYKRIYHNLPYLLKKKGTIDGIRTLINLYGIPDTVLRINEFGGKNRNNSNDWDYFQNQFNYAFFTTSSGYIFTNFLSGSSTIFGNPKSIEFRFRTTGIPSSSYSQSLLTINSSSYNIVLEYTGSGLSTGSFSGSIVNSYNEYGTLKLIDNNLNSASVYLPIFNGDWWSVLLTTTDSFPYTSSLFVKNKIYKGNDGNQIGFQASSSVASGSFWATTSSILYLSNSASISIGGKTYTRFSGSFQELRFYNTQLSESVFDDFVMNPYSIESNQLTGSQETKNSLMFRAPLGSLLNTSTSATQTSIHPSITGSSPVTQSFNVGTSRYTQTGSFSYIPNIEIFYFDQFPDGIRNAISNKVRSEQTIIPDDNKNTLSPLISLQQNYPISESYTKDINYLEVAFSPQNEINDDIISQLGYFNIGDYIGDPRNLINTTSSNFYPDFNKLRDKYFQKYKGNYKLNDYIRLIKYFDNSLFKLIQDFVPARTSLASGVVIKQHLLERNLYPSPQVDFEFEDYSGSVKSYPSGYKVSSSIYQFKGESGGILPNLSGSISSSFTYPGAINVTQSWLERVDGPKGISYITHNSQDEFYNGEFSGSILTVTTQSLNNNPFLDFNNIITNYTSTFYFTATGIPQQVFLDPSTEPNQGEIYFYAI